MTASPLLELIQTRTYTDAEVARRTAQIHADCLSRRVGLDGARFTRLSPSAVEHLFDAYDDAFFEGRLGARSERDRLTFRLSGRLTRAAGQTRVVLPRGGCARYDIAISTALLAETFGAGEEVVRVCGRDCRDRVEVLQRVLEHETIHLLEQWLWQGSSCARARFRDLAHRFFAHSQHTHQLITPRERAARAGVRPGTRVAFSRGEERLVGVVNRVTRRATVLVEDAGGPRYSDGKRYRRYYVPLSQLEPA